MSVDRRPPQGYTVRNATPADFGAVFGVISAADQADWGGPDVTEADLRFEWSLPQLELATDVWPVEFDGRVCAYGWLLARNGHRELDGWYVVHPDHRGRGLEPWLLDIAERRAAEHAALAPSGEPVLLRMATIAPDTDAHALLGSRGYEQARSFWNMSISLEPPVPKPALPDRIRVDAFDRAATDPRVVHAIVVDAFAGSWGWVAPTFVEWAARMDLPGFDPALWFVASDGDEAIGIALCAVRDERGHVDTLGVRPGRQRHGIGGALLRWSFAAFAERGVLDVDLGVDSENATGAVGVYERAGMRPTRRYDVFVRRLTGSGPAVVPTP